MNPWILHMFTHCNEVVCDKTVTKEIIKFHHINIITYITNDYHHFFRSIRFILHFSYFKFSIHECIFKNKINCILLNIFNSLFRGDYTLIYNGQKINSVEIVWRLFLHKFNSQSSQQSCFLILIFLSFIEMSHFCTLHAQFLSIQAYHVFLKF